MSKFDLIFFGVVIIFGVGIYILSGILVWGVVGLGIVILFFIVGLVSLLVGFCYVEFLVCVLCVGLVYMFVYVIIGELCVFIIGWNLFFEYVIVVLLMVCVWSLYLDVFLLNDVIKNFMIMGIGKFGVFGVIVSYFDFFVLFWY